MEKKPTDSKGAAPTWKRQVSRGHRLDMNECHMAEWGFMDWGNRFDTKEKSSLGWHVRTRSDPRAGVTRRNNEEPIGPKRAKRAVELSKHINAREANHRRR
ncbi:hypothetical protein R1flu_005523 [Riccia fluitans]|uniref:Uncharacterized protein n=1 Tax=Riccia fluitans TaxID=41844 RepID=A0ABD1YW59_9MARC